MRSVFFVALGANDMAVKQMQSFTSLEPNETLTFVGCHEHRSQTPRADFHSTLAVRTPTNWIEPISDLPDVFDFPRDIQPMLNALCTACHGYQMTARGGPAAAVSCSPVTSQPALVPRIDWFREMKRYGLVPLYSKPKEITNVYAVEREYRKSLWHHPTQSQNHYSVPNPTPDAVLGRQILNYPDLPLLRDKAHSLLITELSAGGGYGEVWIRDLNTFIEIALQVNPDEPIRHPLLTYLK